MTMKSTTTFVELRISTLWKSALPRRIAGLESILNVKELKTFAGQLYRATL
jgi:hypothetical protein